MSRALACLAMLALAAPLFALDAEVNWAAFRSADPNAAYWEVYLYFSGKSLEKEKTADSLHWQSYLEVRVTVSQNGAPVRLDEWQLGSPLLENPRQSADLLDQRRFQLPHGRYLVEVEARDLLRQNNVFYFRDSLSLESSGDVPGLSDLELLWQAVPRTDSTLGQFYKHGLLMLPQVHSFYGKADSVLSFFFEAYRTEPFGAQFLVRCAIEAQERPGVPEAGMVLFKKFAAGPVQPVLLKLPLNKLPSGNYRLVVELMSPDRQVVQRRAVAFQRSNPVLDAALDPFDRMTLRGTFVDTLSDADAAFGLRALEPLLRDYRSKQVAALLEEKDPIAQKQFLLSYWVKNSPLNPYVAYRDHAELARYVDQRFRFGGRGGLMSDRGYVYLRYGKPDDVVLRENDPDVYPYEIWTYLQIEEEGTQNNVDFVFYNPTLTNGNFQLLHSTARNERSNDNWRAVLSKRNNFRQGASPPNTRQRADDVWED
jgi:GWxTD domain-containing protein